MHWWVFHSEQLDKALAAREEARIMQGLTAEDAKAESQLIYVFLTANLDQLGGKR
jgi:hypothetical protein